MNTLPSENHYLVEWLAEVSNDPYAYVMGAFPWGKGELAKYPDGPDEWQRELLEKIRDGVTSIGEGGQAPILPETQTLSTEPRKRSKSRKKAPSVSQKVNILINISDNSFVYIWSGKSHYIYFFINIWR